MLFTFQEVNALRSNARAWVVQGRVEALALPTELRSACPVTMRIGFQVRPAQLAVSAEQVQWWLHLAQRMLIPCVNVHQAIRDLVAAALAARKICTKTIQGSHPASNALTVKWERL
jgi:hypothetical protein